MFKLYSTDKPTYNMISTEKAQDHPIVEDFDEFDIFGVDFSPQKENDSDDEKINLF